MLLLLLPSAWFACFLFFRGLAARQWIEPDWRFSFILAAASWGVMVTLGTEILSLAAQLNAAAVRLFWLAANVGLWTGLYLWRSPSPSLEKRTWTVAGALEEMRAWPLDARLLMSAALTWTMFLGGIALITTTTNIDSLNYHLARVMHWLQQQSIAHYPTNMDSQLQMGPWSGFVQVHLWLLWGNDRFENMLQWSAMAGCLVVATRLIRQLLPADAAFSSRAQAFGALLIVTLPTGIVESISTQTDYTTGFWLMSLASLALAWCQQPGNGAYAAGFGATLGLGVLTKFTMLIFAAPIGLATVAVLIWKQRNVLSQVVLRGTGALAICLALALPHFIRNQVVYGSAIGAQSSRETAGIPRLSINGILFNAIHNLELHSNTGIKSLTHQLNQLAHAFLWWGTGRRPNDPELCMPGGVYEAPDDFFVSDSFAASPWHVGLIGVAAAVGLIHPQKNRLALAAMGLAWAGFVFFCAALRWQLWNSRYHLPGLLLCMPIVATLLAPRISRWLTYAAGTGLLIFGIFIVANNRSRPIFDAAWRAQPRLKQLLSFYAPIYYEPMRDVARQITAAGCHEVGLKDVPGAEYALWLMLREAGFQGEIHHQFVEGPSARLQRRSTMPDVLVTILPGAPAGSTAVTLPTRSEIGPFTLFWSQKISERRQKTAK